MQCIVVSLSKNNNSLWSYKYVQFVSNEDVHVVVTWNLDLKNLYIQ